LFLKKKKDAWAIVGLAGACGLIWLASSSFQPAAGRLSPRNSQRKSGTHQAYQNTSEKILGETSDGIHAKYNRQKNSMAKKNNLQNSEQPNAAFAGESYEDMPDLFSEKKIVAGLVQASAMKIWLAQDKVIQQWPKYEEVKDQLQAELFKTFNLKKMTVESLLAHALKYRQAFWNNGGANSSGAFNDIFTARLFLEMAYGLAPTNMAVADELVETIQAAHPLVAFENGFSGKIRNTEVEKKLWEIRLNQFCQTKKEISAGRKAGWDDFIRVVDACVLGSHSNKKTTIGILNWLYQNSAQGGWDVCHPIFSQFSQTLGAGKSFSFNIYIPTKAKYPREYRFSRRLPSFRGPSPQKRGLILWPRSRDENIALIKH